MMSTEENKIQIPGSPDAANSPACAQSQPLAIDANLLAACIHCGLCLPACPTYLATGRETESPRGRIYLLNQWNQGNLPLNDELYDHIDTCLGCLGCQTACPSGVQYEQILNQARPFLTEKRPKAVRLLMRTAFSYILPNYVLLWLGGLFLRVWQALGIDRLLCAIAERFEADKKAAPGGEALHVVPPEKNLLMKFAQWHQFLPKVPPFKRLPQRAGNRSSGEKIQLFSGCIMDVFYNHVNNASLDLLIAQDKYVENPKQTCCGALAFHAGEVDITKSLAKRNIALFEQTDGPIAVTAAGCGAMLKEYGHILKDDPEWSNRAAVFSGRVLDITEALAHGNFMKEKTADASSSSSSSSSSFSSKNSFKLVKNRSGVDSAAEPLVVAYHAACHLAHAQQVRKAPAELLSLLSSVAEANASKRANPGATGIKAAENAENQNAVQATVKLMPLREAEHCCGSAGIYNLMHPELALKVLDRKMDNLEKTGADVVVTTNPGCLLQLETGIRRRGLNMKAKHLCELLHEFFV